VGATTVMRASVLSCGKSASRMASLQPPLAAPELPTSVFFSCFLQVECLEIVGAVAVAAKLVTTGTSVTAETSEAGDKPAERSRQ
jgi:hypothetical protein